MYVPRNVLAEPGAPGAHLSLAGLVDLVQRDVNRRTRFLDSVNDTCRLLRAWPPRGIDHQENDVGFGQRL